MDTIFANATAPIKAGVAVIRISGENAGKAVMALTGKPLPEPRKATLSKIYNPKSGELIDEPLILWFKSPFSFTGEDTAELHIHGSRAVITELYQSLNTIPGLRLAEAGEFSRRAFENGKMDLTEAEGLADLIDAETKIQARMALRQKQGDLGALYEKWRGELLTILANIEAYIDFPDEEIPPEITNKIQNDIAFLISGIASHLNDNKRGERLRNGLNVAIIGPPNAGKSSLLNILAKRDVAIVSEHAGTTRDIIETHLDLGGYPIIIADTAGIRENAGEIEAEGIKRAISKAENADFRIIVCDIKEASKEKIEKIINDSNNTLENNDNCHSNNFIIIFNKNDLSNNNLENLTIMGKKPIAASFKNGEGIDQILSSIKDFAEDNFNISGDPIITRERHRNLLKEVLSSLENFSLDNAIELAAEDLRYAANSLGKITGRIDVEEILGKIFSSFCIGK